MFNPKKPTVQMLGRWQPWHEGHTELFKKALSKTGQVAIMVRNPGGEDNPFNFHQVRNNIVEKLSDEGFLHIKDYIIIETPNIVDISYGRGVGYTFTQHDLGEDMHNISATKERQKLKREGKL
jgi:hypothetical protein